MGKGQEWASRGIPRLAGSALIRPQGEFIPDVLYQSTWLDVLISRQSIDGQGQGEDPWRTIATKAGHGSVL